MISVCLLLDYALVSFSGQQSFFIVCFDGRSVSQIFPQFQDN